MNKSEQGPDGSFCTHGNIPGTCSICLESNLFKETSSEAQREFKIHEVREQIVFLERQAGREIIETDLTLLQTISNPEKQRTTFVFKLEGKKSIAYFEYPTFYHFMNEPAHKPPRFEIDRVYCNSEDPDDMFNAETVFAYVNGAWKSA